MTQAPDTESITVATADGDCTVFYNEKEHEPEDDAYLQDIGWYYQSLKYDEAPRGPYETREEAEHGAKDDYGDPTPALGT